MKMLNFLENEINQLERMKKFRCELISKSRQCIDEGRKILAKEELKAFDLEIKAFEIHVFNERLEQGKIDVLLDKRLTNEEKINIVKFMESKKSKGNKKRK